MAMYKILNNIPDTSSCSYYRNLLPSIFMRDELLKHGIQLDNSITFNPDSDYDCYIFSRIMDNSNIFPIIDHKLRLGGKKIIWDIDDELWNVPKENPAYDYYMKEPQRINFLSYYFNMSCIVIASTPNLAKSTADHWKLNPSKIVILENLIDVKSFYPHYHDRCGGPIRILWSGSNSHAGDLEPLDELFMNYEKDNNVMFIFYGYIPEKYKALPPNKLVAISQSNRKYYEYTLSFIQPDIALMPLADSQFNKCKSSIKYFEMSMAGAACMASNISPYLDAIEHRETGILCSNINDWKYLCDELIQDKDARLALCGSAINQIQQEYSWNYDNRRRQDWFDFFLSIPDL